MQRTPLLCGWMSVAMFSSLGLPGLNGFIGEFLIFKGSFALAAAFTAVAVLGLLFTAIVFMRAMQSLFSGPLAESCSAFPDLAAKRKVGHRSRHAAHVRHRHRAAIRLQHLQHNRRSDGATVWLRNLGMTKEIILRDRIAQSIYFLRGQKVLLDFDLAMLYGVTIESSESGGETKSGSLSRRCVCESARDAGNKVWGAHAPRVLAMAPSPSRTCSARRQLNFQRSLEKKLFGEAPKRAREARALPNPMPMIAWTIYLTFAGAIVLLFLPRILRALDCPRHDPRRVRDQPARILRNTRSSTSRILPPSCASRGCRRSG